MVGENAFGFQINKHVVRCGQGLGKDDICNAKQKLTCCCHVQASIFAGFFAKRFPAFRDRLISDHRFLFKVVAEVLIDSGESWITCQEEDT